jgi:anti-anti-sigma factor
LIEPDFAVVSRREGGDVVVEVCGELDVLSAAELRRVVARLIDDHGISSMVFDIRDMTFIDAAGVSVFVYALRRSRECGGVVRVLHSRPIVQRVFDITGLSSIIPTFALASV